mgnify:CR=1 FL=1
MARTVLIVDDVEFVRKTLTEIFTAARYQVVAEAADGVMAIGMYKKFNPDLVTMDVVMPRLGGIEAVRQICNHNKEARVIVISGMGQESLVMEAIHAGAKDYIVKPFTAEDVLKTAERAFVGEVEKGSKQQQAKEVS